MGREKVQAIFFALLSLGKQAVQKVRQQMPSKAYECVLPMHNFHKATNKEMQVV